MSAKRVDSVSCTTPCVPKMSEESENDAQKKPEPLLQIQRQNRHMNHDFAGMLQLRSNSSQRIAPLADSEASFNVAPLA